jgi:tryptophanyl-tRNA synthetase
VAAGLDIDDPNTFIYRQSFIPAHSELTWILDCFTGIGELSRMTQFKDKSRIDSTPETKKIALESIEQSRQQLGEKYWEIEPTEHINNRTRDKLVNVGLFNYPVLMAADILLYGAKYVPVGEDQRQHLELTRDLAIRLNNKFGRELFTVPVDWNEQLKFAQRDSGVRIRSLRNPDKKMSKSVSDPSGTIMLSDDPAEAAKKILRAETDSLGQIKFDFTGRPGISNLLQMLALLTDRPQPDVNTEWEGRTSYGELKQAVAREVEKFLTDLQTKLAAVDEAKLLAKLEQDEATMRQVADATLLHVQQVVGLRPHNSR